MKAIQILVNMVRGGLIGMAELVPGVSGGTIALVTGVYERVLHQANLFLDATKQLPKDRKAAFAQYKALDWKLLLPMLVVAPVLSTKNIVDRMGPSESKSLATGGTTAFSVMYFGLMGSGAKGHVLMERRFLNFFRLSFRSC